MSTALLVAADLVAISVMVFGLYFPRHRRKDLALAYLVVNLGVLAVAEALTASGVSAGLGLGLFGVLSIIRLRSTELDHEEVAYYFAALALGLLGGLSSAPGLLTIALMTSIVAALWIGDHPRLLTTHHRQVVTMPSAYRDQDLLRHDLDQLLGGRVHQLKVRRLDLVDDTTVVEVRFEVGGSTSAAAPHDELAVR